MKMPEAEVVITWRERESIRKQTIAFASGVVFGLLIAVIIVVVATIAGPKCVN